MKPFVFAALLAILSVVLPGCTTFAPAYPKDLVTFDEELIGTWHMQAPPDAAPDAKAASVAVIVERRDARMDQGKLAEIVPLQTSAEVVPAYRIRFEADAREGETRHFPTLDAVLLRIEGVDLLATQISPVTPGVVDQLRWLVPVHRVFRINRSGDRVTLASMKHEVIWMPIQPLDVPAGTPTDPVRLPDKAGFSVVTRSDRYVDVLRAAVRKPDFWEQSSINLRRAAPSR